MNRGDINWKLVDGGLEGVGPTGRRASLESHGRSIDIWLYDEQGEVAFEVVLSGGLRRCKAYAADYLLADSKP